MKSLLIDDKVLSLTDLNPTEVLVLAFMKNKYQYNKYSEFYCFPEYISEYFHIGCRTVKETLKNLVEKGYIKVRKGKIESKKQYVNFYTVCLGEERKEVVFEETKNIENTFINKGIDETKREITIELQNNINKLCIDDKEYISNLHNRYPYHKDYINTKIEELIKNEIHKDFTGIDGPIEQAIKGKKAGLAVLKKYYSKYSEKYDNIIDRNIRRVENKMSKTA